MPEEITQRVLHVIADAQHLPIEQVTIDKSFEDLGIDSMDGVSLLFALESEFDISIPDNEAKNIHTVREMCEGVAKIIEAKQSPPAPSVATAVDAGPSSAA